MFDKGRAVGGRLTARRTGGHAFDLGAQYFTVRDERFALWVVEARARVACAPWPATIVALDPRTGSVSATEPQERLVGTPDMNALARLLADGLDVRTSCRVEHIEPVDGTLALAGTVAESGVTLAPLRDDPSGTPLGTFDALAVCVPATQAVDLLEAVSPHLAAIARRVEFVPCWALGLVDATLATIPFDGAFVGRDGDGQSPLAWIARDSSKPGRPEGQRWMVHASGPYTSAHRETSTDEITATLVGELARLLSCAPLSPTLTTLQCWSLARAAHTLGGDPPWDASTRIGLAGDWTGTGQIEGAFLSGLALAERILDGG